MEMFEVDGVMYDPITRQINYTGHPADWTLPKNHGTGVFSIKNNLTVEEEESDGEECVCEWRTGVDQEVWRIISMLEPTS